MTKRDLAITPGRLLIFALLVICAPLVIVLRIGYGVTYGVLVILAWFVGMGLRTDLLHYLAVDRQIAVPDWVTIAAGAPMVSRFAAIGTVCIAVHAAITVLRAVLPKDFRYHTAYIGMPTIPITRKFDKELLPFIVLAPGAAYFFPDYVGDYLDYRWIPALAIMAVAYYALLSHARADYTLAAFDPIQQRYKPRKKPVPTLVQYAPMPRPSRENLEAIFSRRPAGLAGLVIREK